MAVIQTIDAVLLTIYDNELVVALAKRDKTPFINAYALPGGYIHQDEDSDCLASAIRVLQSKTGIVPPYLEQLQTFSGKYRDPRGWSVSVAYFALVSAQLIDHGNNASLDLFAVDGLRTLPFDHISIIQTAVERIRNKSQYSSLPCFLAGDTFTLPALQKIYEICLGESLNKVSFRRKISEMDVLDVVDGQQQQLGAHRPAQVYKLKVSWKNKLMLLNRGM